jgi:hypothetical protein
MSTDEAEGYVVFYTAPGAEAGDPVEDKLLRSHEAEAEKQGAELNYGWSTGDNAICSKTAKGILESNINPKTMQVRHFWTLWGSPEDLMGRHVSNWSLEILKQKVLADQADQFTEEMWIVFWIGQQYRKTGRPITEIDIEEIASKADCTQEGVKHMVADLQLSGALARLYEPPRWKN